jgi:hypothetical protein
MPRASSSATANQPNAGVTLLLVGVGIVIVSQLWHAVPMCGAIALIAWGTALSVQPRCGWLMIAAAVYTPLAILAVTAQVDLAIRSPSLAWGLLAGLDAAAAIALFYSLARQTGELLAAQLPR